MFNWIKDNPLIFLLIFLAVAAPPLFVGAMRVIFYIVVGIVLLLLILGLIFRAKIRRLQRDMEDQMGGSATGSWGNRAGGSWGGFYSSQQGRGGQQRGGSSQASSDAEQPDVKIFKQRGVGEKKVAKDVGDYVDFEEIKEESK